MLDLNQLRYFVTVAELEHVGRAAERLNMTQSPLSRQIQDLEDRLGVLLFDRVKKRLRLTHMGRCFLEEAKGLLEHASRVERNALDLAAGKKGILEIGYVEGAMNCGVLPDILRVFKVQEPDIEMRFHCLRSVEQIEALESGRLDIGFTYSEPWPSETLEYRKIHEESFLLASPEGAPKLKELQGGPVELIALSADVSFQARAEFVTAMEKVGLYPDIKYEVTKPTAILRLVSAGIGHAVMQESMVQMGLENVRFEKMPDKFPYRMEIYMVKRKEHPAIVDKFNNVTYEVCTL